MSHSPFLSSFFVSLHPDDEVAIHTNFSECFKRPQIGGNGPFSYPILAEHEGEEHGIRDLLADFHDPLGGLEAYFCFIFLTDHIISPFMFLLLHYTILYYVSYLSRL